MTSEPILIMAFNRPDHLKVLIDRLRQIEPTKLFVAIDGARPERPDEFEKVQDCKALIATIDWPCDVETNYQPKNLGCGLGVSTAISWFFSHVERGIILEDDIIPDQSFFPYCSELLDRYEHDDRVFAISGCNFVPIDALTHPEDAYRFSQVPHIWGWATWRRSWMQHQLDIQGWKKNFFPFKLWARSGYSLPATTYWASTFELLARKEVDTWDGQLVFASMKSHQFTATSNVNLIENIGFGSDATHTKVDRHELQPVIPIDLPTSPIQVVIDKNADRWTRKHHFRATWRGIAGQADTYLKQRRSRKRMTNLK